MPRLAANLSMLFTEWPLLDRFGAAAQAGFTAVELQFPYEAPAEALARALQAHRLSLVLHNLPVDRWAQGERGLACHPGREAEFAEGLERALHYAQALQVPCLNVLSGLQPQAVSDEQAFCTLVANLAAAVPRARAAGVQLLVEPINALDVPGFWLNRVERAVAVMDAVDAQCAPGSLKLQLDLYHQQRSGGELAGTVQALLPRIGHLQMADNPGRHEPGTGEIRYAWLLPQLDAWGYTGWVGCEYRPRAGTVAGLGWLAAHGVALSAHPPSTL